MSQGINEFSRIAAQLPDATPLRADQNQIGRAPCRSGATRAETMQANTETARTFLTAVRAHPGYAAGGAEAERKLQQKMDKGLPLCADEVRQIARQLNVAHAKHMGDTLETASVLPAGTSTAFVKHLLGTHGSLEGEHGLRSAVRDFLLQHAIPRNADSLVRLDAALVGHDGPPLSTEEQQAMHKALFAYHGTSDAADCMKVLLVKNIAQGMRADVPPHPAFGRGFGPLAQTGLNNLFAEANRKEIQLLLALPQECRSQVLSKPDMLHVLMYAQNTLNHAEQVELVEYMDANRPAIRTEAEQRTVLRDFALLKAGLRMTAPLPQGLPAQLGLPLALNSQVKQAAIEALNGNPGPNVTPSRSQIETALRQARDDFATTNAPLLCEYLQMAQDPPAGLDITPPLTPQTLPLYLNALLSGDTVFEPLFNDSRPVDADFFRCVQRFNDDLRSAGDVSDKAPGVDDANRLHENVLRLLMARRGAGETEYPAMLERGIARFSRLVSELNTLSGECFSQGQSDAQNVVLAARRVLSATMISMAEQLSPENRASLSLPAETRAMHNALFEQRDVDVPTNELSTQMHTFGKALGLKLPPTNSRNALDAMQRDLQEANEKSARSQLHAMLGTGERRRAATLPFQNLVNDVVASLDLDQVDTALLNPARFEQHANAMLDDLAATISQKNETVDAATVHEALRQSIAMDLQDMHALMAAIDALPKPSNLSETQHAEQKRIMKDMLHLHPIQDLSVLSRMMGKAGDAKASMDTLRAPLANPFSITTAMAILAQDYAELASAIGERRMPPQSTAMRCYLDILMRTSHMSAANASVMHENLIGEAGRRVGAACTFVIDSDAYSAEQKRTPQIAHALLTHLATISSDHAGKPIDHQPDRFAEGLTHLSEFPHGCISYFVPSTTTLQDKLNQTGTRFSPEDWELLERTGTSLTHAMRQNADALSTLLAVNATSILELAHRGNATPLTVDQIATALLGTPLTAAEKRNGASDGERLYNAFVSRYTMQVRAHNPAASPQTIEKSIRMGLYNGLPRSTLFDLARPDGKLTLNTIPPQSLELGSLGNVTEENVFGLREDFPRLHGGGIAFTIANGEKHTYSSDMVPRGDQSIPADHPVFEGILDEVRARTDSEAQMLRIMQIFSQGGRMGASLSQQSFPINDLKSGLVPPMNYTVTSGEDNSVLVSMESLANSPLYVRQDIVVNRDGTYRTTEFLAERRHVA